MPHTADLDLTPNTFSGLTSADAVAGFFTALGYDTGRRIALTAEAIGLSGESAAPIKKIELLSDLASDYKRVCAGGWGTEQAGKERCAKSSETAA